MSQFGAQLRKLRHKKGMTQEQVARELEITVRAYQHYESGARTPKLPKAAQLAELLGVTLDELSVRDCTTDSGESA